MSAYEWPNRLVLMSQSGLEYLDLPGCDASPLQGLPYSIKFAIIHLHAWVAKQSESKCLPQERHNYPGHYSCSSNLDSSI